MKRSYVANICIGIKKIGLLRPKYKLRVGVKTLHGWKYRDIQVNNTNSIYEFSVGMGTMEDTVFQKIQQEIKDGWKIE